MISIPVSVGELLDKLSILHVKKIKIFNEEKLSFINKEFELLYNMSSYYLNDIELLCFGYGIKVLLGFGYDEIAKYIISFGYVDKNKHVLSDKMMSLTYKKK